VTGVTTTTATVSGSVNPNGAQLIGCHFQVTPAPPIGGAFPCAQQIPTGSSSVPVFATLSSLSPATTYTVTLIATNGQGTASGAAVTFQTAAGGPMGPGTGPVPVVSSLKLTPSRFRLGTQAAQLAGTGKVGTTISFTLSTAATVKLTFARISPGRRAHHGCVRATPALRRAPRCMRFVSVAGTVIVNAPTGPDKLRFDGVLDGGHRLMAGTYVLSLVARVRAGQASVARRAQFTLSR
jgi:hypothetical protein